MSENSETVDLRGYRCPMPALKLRARLKGMPSGHVVEVLTDDPLAGLDIPTLCREAGHILLSQEPRDGDEIRFVVRRS